MKISNIETTELGENHCMIWTGFVESGLVELTWVVAEKTAVTVFNHEKTWTDMEFKHPFYVENDEIETNKIVEAIKRECFPCRACMIEAMVGQRKERIIGWVPNSEFERVGLKIGKNSVESTSEIASNSETVVLE